MNRTTVVDKAEGKTKEVSLVGRYLSSFLELGKFRLSLSVAFSSLAAYFLTANSVSWNEVALLGFGGLLLAMSANAFNQYLERDIDSLMDRTASRPLVKETISPIVAIEFVALTALLALIFLGLLCWCALLLGAVAWITYIVGYTLLKRRSPRAVELGSLSGALPAAIGVLVVSPSNWLLASLLFMVQFIWQYPHTWIILKLYENQYSLIGTKVHAPKRFTQSLLITSLLPPVIMIPVGVMTGISFLLAVSIALGFILWIVRAWLRYYREGNDNALRKLLIVNLLMLPLNYALFIILKFIGL
ncbi:MAG: protoheme IX farnesyltransferase [Chlorobi bacterium]|nr:protoheme IX farnesyltransferase [Chlorobiota bacterium]